MEVKIFRFKIVCFHILYWGIYIFRSLYFWPVNFHSFGETVLIAAFLAVPAYFNYFILVPRILYKSIHHNGIYYFLLWIFLYGIMHFGLLHYGLPFALTSESPFWNPIRIKWTAIMFMYVGTFVTGARLVYDWYYNESYAKQLEEKKQNISILKLSSSINPAFINSTLNYLIAQSIVSPRSISKQLVLLAEILRHINYESLKKRIPVSTEIEVLEQYLQLENGIHQEAELVIEKEILFDTMIPPSCFIRISMEWINLVRANLKGKVQLKFFSEKGRLLMLYPRLDMDLERISKLEILLQVYAVFELDYRDDVIEIKLME